MKTIKTDEMRMSVKFWVEHPFDIETSCWNQIYNLANLPFLHKHVAIMPDTHTGYGMPLGGVIATIGVIIPNAVGVDIGCGMCALKTNIKYDDQFISVLPKIMNLMQKRIRVGFFHNDKKADEGIMPNNSQVSLFDSICMNEYDSARYQVGTLGGGNHFLEIQKDQDDHVWIMIHSGSRNLGLKVANFYNKEAKVLNEKYYSLIPKNWDLAFLPMDTILAKEYMSEMQYCVDFAFINRTLMMEKIKNIFWECTSDALRFEEMINIAHNYAAWENHFNKNVIVHRKGATRANNHEIGIIPGSQGSKSFIVEGLGNIESFNSCSHGAGRKMGRGEAKRTLDLKLEKANMDVQGILHNMTSKDKLDEATGAYKDIDEVMKNQKDLVKIVYTLNPLAVVKG